MLRIQFNNGAPLRMSLPRAYQKQEIFELALAFATYEATLPPAEQTPFTARIQTALAEVQDAHEEAVSQEANRKAASEALKRHQQTAKTTVNQIRNFLAAHFAHAPEQAQAWGFVVRQTGRSAGQILMPQSPTEITACLTEYINTETARPEAERFSQPLLADVITLRDNLVQQRQQRNQARQIRLQKNGRVETLAQQLFEELRLALGYLILVQFNGQPDRALAQWGYTLVARPPRTPRETAPEPEPETTV